MALLQQVELSRHLRSGAVRILLAYGRLKAAHTSSGVDVRQLDLRGEFAVSSPYPVGRIFPD